MLGGISGLGVGFLCPRSVTSFLPLCPSLTVQLRGSLRITGPLFFCSSLLASFFAQTRIGRHLLLRACWPAGSSMPLVTSGPSLHADDSPTTTSPQPLLFSSSSSFSPHEYDGTLWRPRSAPAGCLALQIHTGPDAAGAAAVGGGNEMFLFQLDTRSCAAAQPIMMSCHESRTLIDNCENSTIAT